MSKTFITGNMQLGRQSAIGKWKRPFISVDKMTSDLIKNWNEVVTNDDVVYHLGNFAWDPKTAYDSLLLLKGKVIFFILGENDQPLRDLHNKGNLPKNVKLINCSTDQCNFKPQDINSLMDLLKEIT